MLDEKLIELKKEIVEYATLVEKMVKKSLEGLLLKDRQALLEVMQKDEPRVNAYEIDIDELCTNLIAQYQPRAKNLRIILMVL